MKCHEVDYRIIGHEMQVVEVELDANETVIAEAGAMNYFEDGIAFRWVTEGQSRFKLPVISLLMALGAILSSPPSKAPAKASNSSREAHR